MISSPPGSNRSPRARSGPSLPLAAALAAGLLLAAPDGARAQGGVEAFAGNWVGVEIVAADPAWPAMEPGAVAVAIDGDSSDFEAEWQSLALDDGALEWVLADTEFERADRPGYYRPEDDADIFEGESQLWAFHGETGLVLGRLQIDEDSGRHIVYVCRLIRSDTGLEAHLTMTSSDTGVATATVSMVRK